MYPDHERPLADFDDLPVLFGLLLRDFLYALTQCRPHRIQPRLQGLLAAFFYHAFTKLGGHLLNIGAVQIQLFGNLLVGQVQSHKIEA